MTVGTGHRGAADRARVEQLLLRYVGSHSVNPAIDDGPGEVELANLLIDDLTTMGLEPVREPVHPGGRDNVVARLDGAPGSPIVMFHAHLDTVGLSGRATAEPRVDGDLVFGRGACDTKGSLVAMVEAVRLLQDVEASRRATVLLVGGIDEEVAGTGAQALAETHPEIDLAVVGEPTSLAPATAHKGVLRFEIATHGVPAHSSKPHLGVNSIHGMARVLEAIERDYVATLDPVGHRLVGPPTVNVSTIRGGTALNVVPAECVIAIDRRVIPGEHHDALMKEFRRLTDALEDVATEVRAPFLATAALDTPVDARVVRALRSARQTVLGDQGEPIGVTFGTDASFFDPAGIECVVFGPGSIDQAHADDEWVGIEETALAAEILAEVALTLAS